jgi:biotin carboxyl carrier protein
VEVEPGVWSILLEGRSYEIRLDGQEADWRGLLFQLEDEDEATAGSRGAAGPVKIKAVMPGRVVRVFVAPGDVVETDQGLMVIEAMKMQNEVKSPRSGKVTQLRVQGGATVAAGELLAVIE